jgi:hypothetical protein
VIVIKRAGYHIERRDGYAPDFPPEKDEKAQQIGDNSFEPSTDDLFRVRAINRSRSASFECGPRAKTPGGSRQK